jgi:glycosyltransferase involved in cell wall biosynthesis
LRVLFFTQKKDAPSTRWRILQFIPHFKKAGIECDVEEWPSTLLARLGAAKKAAGYDIVVHQKRLLTKLVANRLRRNAKALVFEFDDLLMLKKDDEGAIKDSPTRERRFKRIVRLADAIVTTNEHLADLARRATSEPDRVMVVPTVIDLQRWEPRKPSDETERVTIGWMGTPSNLHSLDIVRAPLQRLCRRFEHVQIKIVCEETLPMEGVRWVHKRFSPLEEVDDIRTFDIAVAPLVEDSWTRGKVSTKLLAYFAAGLPVVASDVNANRLYIKPGENGFLVGTLAQWEERLTALIGDPALRREIGGKARASAERDYSIAAAVPRYLELFQRLKK